MTRDSEKGFSLVELVVATGTLLSILGVVLSFFAKGQVVYTDERATLDTIQDLRTAFDRFTNEVRMAGAGLPGYHGVVSGSPTTLIVRGDFANTTTIITSTGSNTGSDRTVGTTEGFAPNQTVSLLNTITGASALTRITAVDSKTNTITLDSGNLLAVTSGAQLSDFGGGSLINVIERRTYSIKTATDDPDRGSITRAVAYEDTVMTGTVVQPTEIIARNVLSIGGAIGLTFTYYDASDNVLVVDPDTGLVDATKVAKVQIDLDARNASVDLESHGYRTVYLSALVQVRGQYIPAVGF